MYKVTFCRFLGGVLPNIKASCIALGGLAVKVVSLLAASADTSEDEETDMPAGAFKGGNLNYRTGKLDDGTDPYGWY
ncbi:MAG: hypothetical protein R3F50_02485 [Gammaproteobacteria bacterium]